MALPRTQTCIRRQFAPDFAPQGWCWTNPLGFLHPEVGARQNVPEFCKAGRRLNKITGKIVMGQNHGGICYWTKALRPLLLIIFPKNCFPPLNNFCATPSASYLIPTSWAGCLCCNDLCKLARLPSPCVLRTVDAVADIRE